MDIITIKEYAGLRGIGVTAVYNAINAGRNLPGIIDITRSGKIYLLKGNKSLIKKNIKKDLQV
jgi:hypothetical protein